MAIHKKQKSLCKKNRNKSKTDSKSKNRKQNKHQRGGFIATTRPHPTTGSSTSTHPTRPHPTKLHSSNQRGGSPASTLVMQDTMNPPVMNDYVTSPRIRESWYDDSLAGIEPRCNQMGGSPSSDLVMEQLNSVPETKTYPDGWKVKGNMNSLNLYETTGGSRKKNNKLSKQSKGKQGRKQSKKSKKSRKNKNSKHSRRNNRTRSQRGGASDWIMSQYSLGPNNNPEASTSMFSQSTATLRNDYMNPSTLGLAGSGYPMGSLEGANVRSVGAPLS